LYDQDGEGHLVGFPLCIDPNALTILETVTYVWGLFEVWVDTQGQSLQQSDFERAFLEAVNASEDQVLTFEVTNIGTADSSSLPNNGGSATGARRPLRAL